MGCVIIGAVAGALAACLTLSMLITAGCDNSSDDIIEVAADDPQMNAAIAEARGSVDRFISRLDDPAWKDARFAVKKEFNEGGESEFMWLGDVSYDGQKFSGTLDNEPQTVRRARMGQRYDVRRSDLADWMIERDGRIYGGYTLRALLPQMSAEEQAEYRAVLADPQE